MLSTTNQMAYEDSTGNVVSGPQCGQRAAHQGLRLIPHSICKIGHILFSRPAEKPYGSQRPAGANDLAPKSNTLIPPTMRSTGGPAWLLAKRLCISLLALFGLVGSSTFLQAQLIPADRLTDWTPGVRVGVPGGIPTNRTKLIDVTASPYNADRTGSTDASQAIQAAINAAAAE